MHNISFSRRSIIQKLLPFVLLGVLFTLTSCSTVSQKDGPPPFDVDVSKIPDAVPKSERVSKYGNKPVYNVFGKNYHVMSSSKNYEEQGIASWYGTKFHARHTSNGERYDMLGMTAAHKTLPLPTYVQVTNLSNGKKVIVKVNDRGPFEGNRIIDLSYVAAKKLGMLGHGTARVDIKAIDPVRFAEQHQKSREERVTTTDDFYLTDNNTVKTPASEVDPLMPSSRHRAMHVAQASTESDSFTPAPRHHARHVAQGSAVYMQVGAFRNRHYAERLKNRVGPMTTSPVKIASGKNMYRVQIGPIKDLATANHINKKLKAAGLSAKTFQAEV